MGIFPNKNHPAIGIPPWPWNPRPMEAAEEARRTAGSSASVAPGGERIDSRRGTISSPRGEPPSGNGDYSTYKYGDLGIFGGWFFIVLTTLVIICY